MTITAGISRQIAEVNDLQDAILSDFQDALPGLSLWDKRDHARTIANAAWHWASDGLDTVPADELEVFIRLRCLQLHNR